MIRTFFLLNPPRVAKLVKMVETTGLEASEGPDLWLEQSPQLPVPTVVWGRLLPSRASQGLVQSICPPPYS